MMSDSPRRDDNENENLGVKKCTFLLMNLVRFPMLFISGVFVPLEAMPGFLQPIAYLMPLTYLVNVLKQTVLGPGEPLMLLGDMTALSLFLALFLGAATMALRRDVQ
jgi:ABC-2 type transport system permease protein